MIMGLCLCVIVCIIALAFLLGYSAYVMRINLRLEAQNERKTEILCKLNNELDEAQKDYDDLLRSYEALMHEREKGK